MRCHRTPQHLDFLGHLSYMIERRPVAPFYLQRTVTLMGRRPFFSTGEHNNARRELRIDARP